MPIRTRPAKRKAKKKKTRVVYVPAPTVVAVQPVESEFERVVKRVIRSPAAQKALEAAERDPDAFVNALKRLVEGVEKGYEFFQRHPAEARRATRNAVISAAANVARRKLGGA